jgi:hypothetical protein
MSTWLKAGLIGGGVAAVLNLLGQIPIVECITWILVLATYCGVGALAAYWMPPVREKGPAAKQGALAGLIATVIGTGAGAIFGVIKTAIFGGTAMPEGFEMMAGVGGAVVFGLLVFVASLAIAPALGALGGLVYASVRPE